MLKSKFLAGEDGSSPVETAALLAVLLLPLGPMLSLFNEVFNALAAESIARHSLRLAVLQSDETDFEPVLQRAVETFSTSWLRTASFDFDCGRCEKGDLLVLSIQVGNAVAVQAAGLEPK